MSWALQKPDYEIRINLRRAREMGLTPDDVALQAYYSLKGGFTDEFYRLPNLRQNTVLVRYEQSDRRSAVNLDRLYISTPDGKQVPLSNVASLEYRKAPTLIEHDGMRRVVTVTGYYRIGGPPSMDLGMDIMMRAMEKMNFPPGYGLEMRGDMTQMMDSFRRLLYGLGLAVFFIYLILVAQFRGFMQPLQMVLSLPLELTGVFLALWLAHQNFSTVSIMSVIVLTGMDITTAVLLVDMIVHYREQGMPREEAVVTACPQRLRPILMTSLITIIAMTPVAFFPRTGMDAYQSVGTVVIGGLLVGTFLSLFLIPVMHLYVDDLGLLLARVLRRKEGQ
jgi:HAE1 family hydrophobic/amphiphilic exporter-1